jgi:hypothetical protein
MRDAGGSRSIGMVIFYAFGFAGCVFMRGIR